MSQRLFQVAKDLRIDSKVIVRKLMYENLPPPGSGPSENGLGSPWTPRSPVSVGLREMIREWHATGELFNLMLETGGSNIPKQRRASRIKDANGRQADGERVLPMTDLPDVGSALTRQALDAIAQIDREARQRKQAQMAGLRESRTAILREIKALAGQISQIDKALQVMAVRPAERPPGQYARTRRDLSALRERMATWLESRRGEKFAAGALAQEFPELENTAVCYVLRPLVEAGRLLTDASAGAKRPTYFAPQAEIGPRQHHIL